jgi:hypothetical protein
LMAIAEKLSVTTGYLLGLTDNPKAEAKVSDLTPIEQLLIAAERMREASDALQRAIDLVRAESVD